MDTTTPVAATVRFNRFLPYAAVYSADVKQTLRSWIYRLWVLCMAAAAVGYLLYRFGARQVAGFVQPAPEMIGDLLTWIVWGSVTLIIVLTSGAISGELGSMADSVLSRGISRHSYFLGKWHARLSVILGTFLAIAGGALAAAYLLLHSDQLTAQGSLVAVALVGSLLVLVITTGVTVSALSNSTIVSITVVWLVLYGLGFGMSWLPPQYPAPDRALQDLPRILKGFFDLHMLSRLISGALSLSLLMGVIGMVGFSRRDI
jgi:ABC-2 type transport system permease protein